MRLGGWVRLWIATSTMMLLFAGFQAFQSRNLTQFVTRAEGRSGSTPAGCIPFTIKYQEIDVSPYAKLGDLVNPPSEGYILDKEDPAFRLEATCGSWLSLFSSVGLALALSVILLFSGVTLRWIFQGFKGSRA